MSDTPEMPADLLLACAAVEMDEGAGRRLRALLRPDIDWGAVVRAAVTHGMTPLLYWHLNRLAPAAVPGPILDHLRRWFHDNARHNMVLSAELLRILRLFAAHGIRAVPFKGPTLAAFAYGNLALRQFNDLDLLLSPADLPRARDLLAATYRPELDLPRAREDAYLASVGQVPFVSADRNCLVELHARVAPRAFHFPLGLDRLWPRLRPLSLGGHEVRILAPEDLLVVLCAHGAKHCWERLGWVCDVAEVLRAHREMSWPEVIEVARSVRCERVVWLGLLLAHDLLRAPVPAEIVGRARAGRAVRALAAQVCRQMFCDGTSRPGGLDNAFFQVRARERLRDGVRYALSLALTPTVADWTRLQVPASLSFLYRLLRPARLAAKYGRHVFGKANPKTPVGVE